MQKEWVGLSFPYDCYRKQKAIQTQIYHVFMLRQHVTNVTVVDKQITSKTLFKNKK